MPSLLLFCLCFQINKGGYEGEVVIFGSTAAQQKAKEMIEDLVAEGNSRYCNGVKFIYFNFFSFRKQ